MTAPALTPAEQAEATRFGIHDEEILRDLADHADDSIPCGWGDASATWRIAMRCCSTDDFVCQKHRDMIRDRFAGHDPRARPRCGHCTHWHPAGSSYADVIREVAL